MQSPSPNLRAFAPRSRAGIGGVGMWAWLVLLAFVLAGCSSAFLSPDTPSGTTGDSDRDMDEEEFMELEEESEPELDEEDREEIEEEGKVYNLGIFPPFAYKEQENTIRIEFKNAEALKQQYGSENILPSRIEVYDQWIFVNYAEFSAEDMAFDPVRIFVSSSAERGEQEISAKIGINGKLITEHGLFFIADPPQKGAGTKKTTGKTVVVPMKSPVVAPAKTAGKRSKPR